jgi:hypothetical protein
MRKSPGKPSDVMDATLGLTGSGSLVVSCYVGRMQCVSRETRRKACTTGMANMERTLEIIVGILLVAGGAMVLIRRRVMTESMLRLKDPLFPRPIRRQKNQQVPSIFLGVTLLLVGVILILH